MNASTLIKASHLFLTFLLEKKNDRSCDMKEIRLLLEIISEKWKYHSAPDTPPPPRIETDNFATKCQSSEQKEKEN